MPQIFLRHFSVSSTAWELALVLKVEVWVRHAAQVYLEAWAPRRAPARNVVLIFKGYVVEEYTEIEQGGFTSLLAQSSL